MLATPFQSAGETSLLHLSQISLPPLLNPLHFIEVFLVLMHLRFPSIQSYAPPFTFASPLLLNWRVTSLALIALGKIHLEQHFEWSMIIIERLTT